VGGSNASVTQLRIASGAPIIGVGNSAGSAIQRDRQFSGIGNFEAPQQQTAASKPYPAQSGIKTTKSKRMVMKSQTRAVPSDLGAKCLPT
jgi:hypothetical protein